MPDNERLVERFEGFAAGMELCNAFTELNDPVDQLQRFLDENYRAAQGDEEAHPVDIDYVEALSYGMPPTGGFGMGIDRLTMLLTDRDTIREVILFPHLREIDENPRRTLPPTPKSRPPWSRSPQPTLALSPFSLT